MNQKPSIPSATYQELVFQPITHMDVWRGPWHRDADHWAVLLTLKCGHKKSVPKNRVPQHVTHCAVCTVAFMKRRARNEAA